MAPGAAPFILPPNRPLAAVMPATCVPCSDSMTPMLTKSAFLPTQVPPSGSIGTSLRISTTNGWRSATSVDGSSVPKYPIWKPSLYGFIGVSSPKSLLLLRSTRTVPCAASYRTPQESVLSPSRLASPAASPPVVYDSRKVLTW